eukprot:971-Eustigmatos_ZCMA.PRE.1
MGVREGRPLNDVPCHRALRCLFSWATRAVRAGFRQQYTWQIRTGRLLRRPAETGRVASQPAFGHGLPTNRTFVSVAESRERPGD